MEEIYYIGLGFTGFEVVPIPGAEAHLILARKPQ